MWPLFQYLLVSHVLLLWWSDKSNICYLIFTLFVHFSHCMWQTFLPFVFLFLFLLFQHNLKGPILGHQANPSTRNHNGKKLQKFIINDMNYLKSRLNISAFIYYKIIKSVPQKPKAHNTARNDLATACADFLRLWFLFCFILRIQQGWERRRYLLMILLRL